MNRREFITLLGGAAAVWPLAARAQQARVPVVGFLDAGSAAERGPQVAAFRKGLAEGGYQDGQNVALEFAWAEGQYGRFAELAADLVRRGVRVIAAPGSGTAALAAKGATTTIPIVFGAGGDPVKEGIVATLNRPGGNVTGVNFFTVELVAKRMQLLRELLPAAKRIAALVNPTDPEGYQTVRDLAAATGGAALQKQALQPMEPMSADEIAELYAADAEKYANPFVNSSAFARVSEHVAALIGAREGAAVVALMR